MIAYIIIQWVIPITVTLVFMRDIDIESELTVLFSKSAIRAMFTRCKYQGC